MSDWFAALLIGLAGSFHCVGMCGPIAFALPINRTSIQSKVVGVAAYNLGRIVTYGLIGAVFGGLGQSIAIAGFQRGLSISLGVVLILSVLLPHHIKSKVNSSVFSFKILALIRNNIATLFKNKSTTSIFSIGFLNGFLPCGLVYIAVAGAIATTSISGGAFYMTTFGLGTVPIMASAVFLGSSISVDIRNKIRKTIPVFIGIMGLLFVLRGMNLGIPYVSPEFSNDCTTVSCCHKK